MPLKFNSFEQDQGKVTSRSLRFRRELVWLLALCAMTGCTSQSRPVVTSAPEVIQKKPSQTKIQATPTSIEIQRLLRLAEDAIARDALTEPEDDNALTYYRAILAIDSENKDAEEGIHRIVEQYLAWALSAIDSMAFAKASQWLERAALANPKAPSIFAVAERLELKRRLARRTIVLPEWVTSATLLPNHDDALMRAIESFFRDIADSVEQHHAKIIIYSSSDEEGRWIYQSVNRHMTERLRATLHIDTPTRIDLVFPSDNPVTEKEEPSL